MDESTEPIEDVVARVRAPYTYGYGDSGEAAMDAERLADEYEKLRALTQRLIDAGPFYSGIDDDFCAACHAYFLLDHDHKPDCAYVLLGGKDEPCEP